MTTKNPSVPKVRPLSPIQVKTQLKAAQDLYEGGDAMIFTQKWYEATKKRIYAAGALWGKE